MSKEQSRIKILPNEVIYYIFGFLNTVDIMRAFTQLNRHYDELVRFYIKKIDLTDGWQGNQQYLEWICETIQVLKVDRLYIHLLTDSCDWRRLTTNVDEHKPRRRNRKSLFQSIIRNMSTSFQKLVTMSQPRLSCDTSRLVCRFPHLRSLSLINISDWHWIISSMSLKNLNLWFNDGIHYYGMEALIPSTVIRFSANAIFDGNCFHGNLIYVNVYISSFVHLIEIVEHTPYIQQLSITFGHTFSDYETGEKYGPNNFQTRIANLRLLNNLTCLSFNTKESTDGKSNEYLRFDLIQLFIDRCCSNKTILTNVVLKLEYIMFSNDMWSTIIRYKNTFDQFHFYASFIINNKSEKNTIIAFITDQFDFHHEDGDPLHAQARFLHVYSLPFTFDKLHGFVSCAELSSRSSFSSVRHLYYTQTRLTRRASFVSLGNRMPRLISIDCNFFFARNRNIIMPKLIIDRESFIYIRFLRFISHCWYRECVCHDLLPRLINQMPHLQNLTTSENIFIEGQQSLLPIKRLDLRQSPFNAFNNLVQYLPHLSRLLLGSMISDVQELSQLLGSLFIGISSLELISFESSVQCNDNPKPYEKAAQKALVLVQHMNNRLRHLRFDYRVGEIVFYFRN